MYYEAIDPLTPIDVLEPMHSDNPFHDAAVSYLRVISLALAHVVEADEPLTAAWGAAFALGLISVTEGRSMREIARELGLSHGTISWHSKTLSKKLNLPPSLLMKDESQAEKSREARNNFVARAGASEATKIDLE